MPYLGNTPSTSFATVVKDSFSGDGSETVFTLSKVATTNSVSVFVENVRQEPTTAYSVSGTTLTFTAAPVSSSGNNIYVLHMNPTTTTTHPSAQALTATSGTFNGNVTVSSTDAGSSADPTLTLYRNSVSPADADFAGEIIFKGRNDNSQDVEYSRIVSKMTDVSDGTEDGNVEFHVISNGSESSRILLKGNGATAFKNADVSIDDNLTLTDGNLIVAGGHGIDFSAQTAASAASASATGELFDRYEEGIFTHTGNANMTINSVSARGFYTIIGDKCFINGFVRFTHSGSDNVSLSLPVAAKADITSPANGECESSNVTWMPSVNTSGDTQLVSMYVASGSSSVSFYNLGTGSGLVTNNGCDSTAEFYYNLNYKIA